MSKERKESANISVDGNLVYNCRIEKNVEICTVKLRLKMINLKRHVEHPKLQN